MTFEEFKNNTNSLSDVEKDEFIISIVGVRNFGKVKSLLSQLV